MKKDKILNSNWFYYLIIMVVGFALIFLGLGFNFNNMYGSTIDWLSQHSVIPEYFRQTFYETGNLVPNLALNLGAGQNIFNYSYYGLLSPIILISYMFPFIDMTAYIIISNIVLYLLTGILFYKFLINNKFKKGLSLFLAVSLITIAPISYHFHHHIMFVSYMPFLILALMGIDKYLKDNKSFLLIISTFLMIMMNYYYSVCSLIVIFIYGVYKILDKNDDKIKNIIKKIFFLGTRLVISVLMSCVLLLPTAYTILNGGRSSGSSIDAMSLLIPNFKELLYKSYSIGITSIFLIALISLFIFKKKKKSEIFLGSSTIFLTIIPFMTYILNGALYIRGKVLIPFILIYLFILGLFIKKMSLNNINIKKLVVGYIILNAFIFLTGYKEIYFYIESLLTFILILCSLKFNKKIFIYLPTILILVILNIGYNQNETYITKEYFNEVNNSDVVSLINKVNIEDKAFYRTLNTNLEKEIANKVYNQNYYQTTIYSSVYNSLYRDFYNYEFGNNIKYRNYLITAGSNNTLFNTLMGVKYIVGNEDLLGYEKIDSSNGINLYYNANAYPIIYISNSLGSYEDYNNLSFPYNIEYMLNNSVVSQTTTKTYDSLIKEYVIPELKDSYSLDIDKETTYTFKLDKPIDKQILFIEFDMDYNESCKNGDQVITINGISNKLTCKSWLYHNENHKFEYVISNNENIDELVIKISKGKYEINNIKTYVMDYKVNNDYIELDNLNINKKKSIIEGKVTLDNSSYLITSIPYDKGFKAYADDKEIKTEIVNKAFLGFRLEKGSHKILIKYNSPWYIEGIFLSLIGVISLIGIIALENKKIREIIMKIMKNKEIIMYLVFGVLTTIVSLFTYYLCSYTFLDTTNDIELQIANIISWIIAVIFAYVTNRKYVFNSNNTNIRKEFLDFGKSRLLTLFLDMALMFLFVTLLKFNDKIVKLFVQFIIIIGNYILSKIFVFKGESK